MLKEVAWLWLIIPPKPGSRVMLSAAKHLPKPLILRHLTQILHCVWVTQLLKEVDRLWLMIPPKPSKCHAERSEASAQAIDYQTPNPDPSLHSG
jgi:hypothetical protein